MRKYLFANTGRSAENYSRSGGNIHLISLAKTQEALDLAYRLVANLAKQGVRFLFVGTKPQAKKAIEEQALRTESPYVNERWLGGTLTNTRTIFSRVRELEKLEALRANNYSGYTKKEGLAFEKKLQKLERNLRGIRNMKSLPQVLIFADPNHDDIAVKEAKKRNIKIIGILDSNSDPDSVDFGIPANDDSERSITLILTILADAIVEARGGEPSFAFKNDEDINLPEEDNPLYQVLTHKSAKRYRYGQATRGRSQQRFHNFYGEIKFAKGPKDMLEIEQDDSEEGEGLEQRKDEDNPTQSLG